MAYVRGIDVSVYQGLIDWNAVKNSGVQIAIVKIGGGDAGLYYDSRATTNYYGAKNAGIAIGGYWFAGGGDARHEAEYFVNGMSPLEVNDVLVLDWEIKHADPVGWCTAFVNRVHELTGVWPLIYFNGSTWNAYNWSPVTNNCGVWVAWYDRDPEGTLPVGGKVYVMHQYTSSGSVPGIAGRVDLDAWFGTLDQFKKYGYKPSTPPPKPVIETKDVTSTVPVPFTSKTVEDPKLPLGEQKVTQVGVDGVRTIVDTVTYTDGVETARVRKSDTITTQPVEQITAVGTYVEPPTPEPSENLWDVLVKFFVKNFKAIKDFFSSWTRS